MAKDKTVGQRLKALREAAGISQRELARRLDLPYSNIRFWETSATPPRGEIIPALARELNTTADELLGIKPVKPKKTVAKGRLQRVFESASKLPRRQQDKVAEFVEAFVNQHANS